MSEIELKKNLFGGFSIGYDCPHCKSRLKSSLNDAGKTDACPDCKRPFVVPGTEERERLRIQGEHEERERQRKAQEEREAAEAARKAKGEQVAARLSPPPVPSPLFSEPMPVPEFDPELGRDEVTVEQEPDHEEVMEDNLKSLVRTTAIQNEHMKAMAEQSKKQTMHLDLIRRYVRAMFWVIVVLPCILGIAWFVVTVLQEAQPRR